MNPRTVRDLRKLSGPLGILLTLLAIAVGIVMWSWSVRQTAYQDRFSAEARYHEAVGRLRKVGVEEQEIKEKSALFQQLARSGVVGEEKRLEWVELLQRLRHDLRLPALSYEFSPQSSLGAASDSGYVFFRSASRIQLTLLHEEDLLRFLNLARQEARALLLVRDCTLSRLPTSEGMLSAECELDWITSRIPEQGR